MIREEVGSACGLYCYRRTFDWAVAPRMLWILNHARPADEPDGPDLEALLRLARDWGAGSVELVHLYAYRVTDPRKLRALENPVGLENHQTIADALLCASDVVVAWGAGAGHGRIRTVWRQLQARDRPPWCLEVTDGGHPVSPVYMGATPVLRHYRLPDFLD